MSKSDFHMKIFDAIHVRLEDKFNKRFIEIDSLLRHLQLQVKTLGDDSQHLKEH